MTIPPPLRRLALVATFLLLCSSCGAAGGGDGPGAPGPGGPDPGAAPSFAIPDLSAAPGPASGTVVLRFTAPEGPGGGTADAYVVRTSRRHLVATNLAAATTWPVAAIPRPPGSLETLTLTGLEPGRTLQFAVQPVQDGVTGPFGFAVSARVPDFGVPAPVGAIPLLGPSTLSVAGATYLLTRDVSTAGTAFTITARDVTLDLGGRRVTYGSGAGVAYGVLVERLWNQGTVTVRNGTLVQASTTASRCDGVHVEGAHHVRVSRLEVVVQGPDADGIDVGDTTGTVRIDHCVVDCRTRIVTDRHYPGVSAIVVEGAAGEVEVDQNRIVATPQWGIKVQGDATSGALVHHNVIQGTRALVANGYMIGVYRPLADVFENLGAGESRGVHVDGVDARSDDAHVHDNVLRVQDQPNAEFPVHWAHGIKLEGAVRARVHHNLVLGTADPGHAEVRALDLDVNAGHGSVVEHNRILAVSRTAGLRAHALQWTAGPDAGTPDLVVRRNVFVATDRLVERAWDAGAGMPFVEDWWVRDLAQGSGHPFVLERFETSDAAASRGHGFVDPVTDVSLRDVSQWADPGPYESVRSFTLAVRVLDGAAPLAGATVVAKDRFGTTQASRTTNADGLAQAVLVGTRVTNGPAFTDLGPYEVAVSRTGSATVRASVPMTGRTALVVDLRAGTSAADDTPPEAPGAPSAHVLGSSRVLLNWAAATDDVGVALYLVTLDGVPVGVTRDPWFTASGLDPETEYGPSVQALDLAGGLSPRVAGARFRSGPEDRGP